MTIWRKGMLAVKVSGNSDFVPTNTVVRVRNVKWFCGIGGSGEPYDGQVLYFIGFPDSNGDGTSGFTTTHFRPATLSDTRAGRELIQLLDSPIPVTTNYDLVDMDEVGR